jgi:HK97 family phage portal protein
MGLFDRFFGGSKKENRGVTYGYPTSGLTLFGLGAGKQINEKTALTFSAVYSCVRVLSESIGQLPVHVFKRESDGDRVHSMDHPISQIVNRQPSPIYTPFSFYSTMASNCLLWGNSYAVIERNGAMRPTRLDIIHPSLVTPMFDDNNNVFYEVRSDGLEKSPAKRYDAKEIIHFRGFSYDGINGISPIALHKDSIGLGMAAVEYGASFFGNGASLSGVLEHPSKLSKEASERLINSWNSKYQGSAQAGKTAVLEEGLKYKAISMPPDQAQFIATRKFSVEDVARIFRVPQHMIQNLDNATYSNIEQQSIDYVVHSLTPWLVQMEQEMNQKLFRENERVDHYVKFNTNGLLRGDQKSRGDYYQTLWNIGAISIDEIRGFEDMNKLPNGQGEKHFIPLNYTELGNTEQTNENNE